MSTSIPVAHHAGDDRFTASVDGGDAVLAYRTAPDGTLDLQHTVVPHEARGSGVADALVRAAVDYARRQHVQLIPTCPYVAAWVRRHPDQADVFTTDAGA